MTTAPRRLALQLTPLFDMLLIVIFAQYMEVREQQSANASRSAAAVQERDQARAELERAQTRLDEQQLQLQKSETDLDRTLEQQRILGELMVELFQVPQDEVTRILSPAQFPAGVQTPEDLARLRERFRQLSLQRAGQMIEHLLSYDEIRKRCDVWDLHVDAQGVATISAGMRSTRIRIPLADNGDVDREQLVTDLYAWYRSLPQPKSLVIILLTYDRSSRIYVTEAVRQVLPILVSRMQTDHSGRIRFEYADLGFRLK